MEYFQHFFKQGFFHIVAIDALDHLLFILAVCAIYQLSDWKKILWVVTSFTLAHSLSLALSVLNLVNVPQSITEFLIAFTIFFTCMENLFMHRFHKYRVIITGFFGLIHGLGFSNALKELFLGMDYNLFETLLPFNLGIECGQLIIISFIMGCFFLIYRFTKISNELLSKIISFTILVFSVYWMVMRFPGK